MTPFIVPEEDRVPILPPRATLHVLVDVLGTSREVFCLKYTKRGHLITLTRVATTRLRRGIAQIGSAGLQFEIAPVEVATGDDLEKRHHFTLHPSLDGDPAKSTPVVNGPGGCQHVTTDLRTIKATEEVMIHRMTDPMRYPEAKESRYDIRLENIFRYDAPPQFHVFVTPMKGNTPVDRPVPFLPGRSANFIVEPIGMSSRHLLFQLRLSYQSRETFPVEHELLIPRPAEATSTAV